MVTATSGPASILLPDTARRGVARGPAGWRLLPLAFLAVGCVESPPRPAESGSPNGVTAPGAPARTRVVVAAGATCDWRLPSPMNPWDDGPLRACGPGFFCGVFQSYGYDPYHPNPRIEGVCTPIQISGAGGPCDTEDLPDSAYKCAAGLRCVPDSPVGCCSGRCR